MAKDLDHRLAITLICQGCGTEWVPRSSSRGGSMQDTPTKHYLASISVEAKDAECPVCNALEQALMDARRGRENRMNY